MLSVYSSAASRGVRGSFPHPGPSTLQLFLFMRPQKEQRRTGDKNLAGAFSSSLGKMESFCVAAVQRLALLGHVSGLCCCPGCSGRSGAPQPLSDLSAQVHFTASFCRGPLPREAKGPSLWGRRSAWHPRPRETSPSLMPPNGGCEGLPPPPTPALLSLNTSSPHRRALRHLCRIRYRSPLWQEPQIPTSGTCRAERTFLFPPESRKHVSFLPVLENHSHSSLLLTEAAGEGIVPPKEAWCPSESPSRTACGFLQ